jgi:hypothetical protein
MKIKNKIIHVEMDSKNGVRGTCGRFVVAGGGLGG